jgi:hypothetical protein
MTLEMMMRLLNRVAPLSIAFACALAAPAAAQETETRPLQISATAEIGVVRSLVHDIQIGRDGYRLDYVQDGGQELLLPFNRFEVQAVARDRHEITLLYQPLTLRTRTRVDNAGGILIDDVTFADDTPLDLQYGFDFYRGTYRYRVIERSHLRVALGGAMQIRNASIIFDGYREDDEGRLVEARALSQDLGPVPVLSAAMRRSWESGWFFEATLDGFYAPVRYLNLRDVDVIGWLYDAAFRTGVPLINDSEIYLSLRFLGGGADGTAGERTRWTQSRTTPRYTWNNLNLAALTIGVRL